jgi:hypothetical protein
MEHYELGVALAVSRIAELRRQAGLLDHYRQVQQQEASLQQAHRWARAARGRADVALWSAGAGILLAIVALVRG